MKIAITGHTAGIGNALSNILSTRGHEIVGISKRHGYNIRNIPKIVPMIAPCDMWINNAQAGYSQTELLYKVWDQWKDMPNKTIWIISTILTGDTGVANIPGMEKIAIAEYKNQKRALEDAFYQLRSLCFYPRMMMIRPGAVATQPGQQINVHGADPTAWANFIIESVTQAADKNLYVEEINLGHTSNPLIL